MGYSVLVAVIAAAATSVIGSGVVYRALPPVEPAARHRIRRRLMVFILVSALGIHLGIADTGMPLPVKALVMGLASFVLVIGLALLANSYRLMGARQSHGVEVIQSVASFFFGLLLSIISYIAFIWGLIGTLHILGSALSQLVR